MRFLLTLLATTSLAQSANQGESVDLQQCSSFAVDETLRPGRHGEQVARAVHSKLVERVGLEDRGFMMGFSFVESEYGSLVLDRYEMIQQIWPITREQFELTKEHYMKNLVSVVDKEFNLEWSSIIYEEMNVPLYSGIAFHLYLHAIDAHPIAWSTQGQAELYNKITSQATIQWTTYMAKLVKLDNVLCTKTQTDLVFLVDESGSIGGVNFQKMMDFVSGVIASLNVAKDYTRVALRTFSDPGKVTRSDLHFDLADYSKNLSNIAANVDYSCDSCFTYTNKGLEAVLDDDFKTSSGMRSSAKRILVVITDGESTEPVKTIQQAARLHADPRNIQVIAIGVSGANVAELNVIASSREQVYFLDDFASFQYVQDQIAESICNAPILSTGNGTAIIGLVTEGTAMNEVDSIIAGNLDLVANKNGIIPGYTNFQLTMAGRTIVKLSATSELAIYMAYNQTHPSDADHDFYLPYSSIMAQNQAEVQLRLQTGTRHFYISVFNYGSTSGMFNIEILSDSATAPNDPMPIPIRCGANAHCMSDATCECNDGYFGNAYFGCAYDLCRENQCDAGSFCNPSNGQCECREGYALINGVCQSPLCPLEPIVATENQYGYAMGYLQSPFYGSDNYPTNFDCEYLVTAPRTEGSCYEIHIEHPFALETSRSCRNDRLELFDIENARDITMDQEADEKTAVICGNACIADGGWIGRTCSSDLRLRFKSDSIITAAGWKVKWILRPKEDCECWCAN